MVWSICGYIEFGNFWNFVFTFLILKVFDIWQHFHENYGIVVEYRAFSVEKIPSLTQNPRPRDDHFLCKSLFIFMKQWRLLETNKIITKTADFNKKCLLQLSLLGKLSKTGARNPSVLRRNRIGLWLWTVNVCIQGENFVIVVGLANNNKFTLLFCYSVCIEFIILV